MDRRRVGLTLVLLLLADSANGQACGGMLTAPGTATSPNYPNNYNTDETCEWTINVPEGSLVLLTFDSFQIEGHFDTFKIYNGGSDRAALLHSFSGDTIPDPMTGTTNQMFLRFTSDGSTTYPGFQFSYTATDTQVCGGTLSAPLGGTVTSPNYPGYYPNYATCHWTITVPEGSIVLLTFDSFEIELGNDFLYIYDGGSDSRLRSWSFSGEFIPDPIISTSNQMILLFTSDRYDDDDPGFQASYTAAVDRCADGSHNCRPQETCYNTADSFTCTVCQDPLGMQSGAIPDGSITASSTYSSFYEPYLARLHGRGGWLTNIRTIGEWLQVDLGEIKKVTGTITQGGVYGYWVKSYKLQHSTDGASWTTYANSEGTEKVFIGNTDYYTPVTNLLDNAVEARYVRFLPQTWENLMSMGAEILGCNIRVDECADGSNNCSPQATCSDTPESFTCTCNPGYIGNGVTCTDVDECASNNGGCAGTCANTVGSFTCSCAEEFVLNTDGLACDACSTLYPGLNPSHNFGVYQNQCFWSGSFRTPRLNYMAAKQACQDEGGTLAMIKDEATQTFLRAHLRSTSGHRQRSYWIGLDDLNTEGTFLWNDGTPLGDYDKFRSDAPNESRDCVTLWRTRRSARWDIKDCNTRRPYICQLSGNGDK
ncbi:neuropilin-2-like [Branchiostoma floridae x Branchiostoma japonicum]